MKRSILLAALTMTIVFGGLDTMARGQQTWSYQTNSAPPPAVGTFGPPSGFSPSHSGQYGVGPGGVRQTYGFSPVRPANSNGMQGQELLVIEDGKFRILKLDKAPDEELTKKSEQARKALADAVNTLRKEESDRNAVVKAKTTISNFLTVQFDHDQQVRKDQLRNLENQINRLKKQIEKRESSKQDLVDLRIKILENDERGLSFPQSWANLTSNSHLPNHYESEGTLQPQLLPTRIEWLPLPDNTFDKERFPNR